MVPVFLIVLLGIAKLACWSLIENVVIFERILVLAMLVHGELWLILDYVVSASGRLGSIHTSAAS